MPKNPYDMTTYERKKSQKEATQNYIKEIQDAKSLHDVLDKLYHIYYFEPKNILKFGRNIACVPAPLDDTNSLRRVEQAAKLKCLHLLKGKDKNYLNDDAGVTRDDISILEKLAHKNTSTATFFSCIRTDVDRDFENLLATKFGVRYHKTPGLK